MRNFRGLTKDGKMVYGWYVFSPKPPEHKIVTYTNSALLDTLAAAYCGSVKKSYIQHSYIVIPESVAQQVGRQDKNEKEIYAGDKITFNVNKKFGTDNRYEGTVYFCEMRLAYCVKCLPAWDMPIYHNLRDIEIIPPEVKEKSK